MAAFRLVHLMVASTLFLCTALEFAPLRAHSNDGAVRLTLQEALSIAMRNNQDVLISEQEVQSSHERVSEAYAGLFPKLSLSGQYERNFRLPVLFVPPNSPFNPSSQTQTFTLGASNNYSSGISVSQVLFDPKVGSAIQIAGRYVEQTKLGSQVTQLDVELDVKKAFYGVLLMQRLLEVSQQSYTLAKANHENVQSLFRHGVSSEFDLLRSEVQVATTEPVLIQAENNLALAKSNLKYLLAMGQEVDITVEGELRFEEVPEDTIRLISAQAVSQSPVLRQLAVQEAILKKNVDIERSAYLPSLSIFGTYQYQTQDNTFQIGNYRWVNTFFMGVQLSYSLFDGFGRAARINQAKIDVRKLEYSRQKAEDGLKIQILQARMKMDEARRRIRAQEKSIDQAQRALDIAQTRFENGLGTQLEILDTQTALTQTRTNHAQAIYDYLIARSEWEHAVGRLH